MRKYDPTTDRSGSLFENLITTHQLKNDAALARALQVAPPVISKIRHGRLPVGAEMILRVHETFEIPVATSRAMLPPRQDRDAVAA